MHPPRSDRRSRAAGVRRGLRGLPADGRQVAPPPDLPRPAAMSPAATTHPTGTPRRTPTPPRTRSSVHSSPAKTGTGATSTRSRSSSTGSAARPASRRRRSCSNSGLRVSRCRRFEIPPPSESMRHRRDARYHAARTAGPRGGGSCERDQDRPGALRRRLARDLHLRRGVRGLAARSREPWDRGERVQPAPARRRRVGDRRHHLGRVRGRDQRRAARQGAGHGRRPRSRAVALGRRRRLRHAAAQHERAGSAVDPQQRPSSSSSSRTASRRWTGARHRGRLSTCSTSSRRGRVCGRTSGSSVDDLGQQIEMREYRKIFHLKFRKRGYNAADPTLGYDQNDFVPDMNKALAGVIRATSAFPAAFEPRRIVKTPDTEKLFEEGEPDDAWFSDGGILHNRPFTETLSTIFTRAAERPVTRWLLSVEPDPEHFKVPPGPDVYPEVPEVVGKALMGIPRYQSIAGDLADLAAHGQRVRRAQSVPATGRRGDGRRRRAGSRRRRELLGPSRLPAPLQGLRAAACAGAGGELPRRDPRSGRVQAAAAARERRRRGRRVRRGPRARRRRRRSMPPTSCGACTTSSSASGPCARGSRRMR